MPVIYMDRSSIDSLDENDIKKIVEQNSMDTKYEMLEAYYRGEHEILRRQRKDSALPNNKIINNMAKYVTDTAIGYFIGKPIVYSSSDEALLTEIQDVFEYNDEQDHNMELAKVCSIDGNAFEMLYIDEDSQIRFVKIDPADLIMIYETGFSAPVAAIRKIVSYDKDKNRILKVEFWTYTETWYMISTNGGGLNLIDIEEHYWNDVPFVEYINNEERIGDFEGIISIMDAYNKVQSNTSNLFDENDDALLKLSKLGDVSTKEVKEMREAGAIILEDGGDIDWLIKNINDTAVENHKKRLREDMHLFSNVPHMGDEAFGSNMSGVAVEYKLWGLEQICAIKERKFKKALQRRIELVASMLNTLGGHYDYRDIEIQFRRNKPQNLKEIAEIIITLSQDLSRESRLKLLLDVENVKDEMEKLRKERKEEYEEFGGTGAGGYDGLAAAFEKLKEEIADEQPEPELLDRTS